MMMERSREKNFLAEVALTRQLDRHRKRLKSVERDDNEERDDRIREQCDNTECRPERYSPSIAYEKAGRIDIEPEKRQERAGYGSTECGEVGLVVGISDKSEGDKGNEKDPAVQTIEPVGLIG